MPMTWGWNVDEEEGQKGYAKGESCLEEPSRRRKVGYLWLRIVEETTSAKVLRERLLQFWMIRFMSEWNMYDTLSEGKHYNNDVK